MSNSIERATPRYEQAARLKCDLRLLQGLRDAQVAMAWVCEDEGVPESGLCWDYNEIDKTIYPYFDCGVGLDDREQEDIAALGAIIAANNRRYLQFGLAVTCDKMVAAGFGGTEFRIYADGGVTWAEPKFPEDSENP